MAAVRERIAIDARSDSFFYNSADTYWYSDDHSTQVGHIDGATGNVDFEGTADFAGAFTASGGLDLNGQKLTIDADGNTSIHADTDNQIDVELEGADQVVFKAVAAADSGVTNEYTEIAFTTPVDTSGTNTHNALTVDLAIGNATGGTNAVNAIQIDSITGDAEVTETAINVDSGFDVGIDVAAGVTNLRVPSVCSNTLANTDTSAKTLCTVPDGEVWIIHAVLVNVTTNFDCTGDDCTLQVGDGNDANGLADLVDAEVQTTNTEVTNGAAGWAGQTTGTKGVYINEATTNTEIDFVYAPSGAQRDNRRHCRRHVTSGGCGNCLCALHQNKLSMSVALTLRPVSDSSLDVKESPVSQSPDEQIIYALTTTNIGSSPTSPAVTATNITTGKTVTAQVLSGSASVSSDVITLPTVQNLAANNLYRIDIQFTISSVIYERHLKIFCKD